MGGIDITSINIITMNIIFLEVFKGETSSKAPGCPVLLIEINAIAAMGIPIQLIVTSIIAIIMEAI